MKRQQRRFISDAAREKRWRGVARMMRRGCQCRRARVVFFGKRWWRERDIEAEGALAAAKLPRHSCNPKACEFEMRPNARVSKLLFQAPVSRSSFTAEWHRKKMLKAKRTGNCLPSTLAQQLQKSLVKTKPTTTTNLLSKRKQAHNIKNNTTPTPKIPQPPPTPSHA